MAGSNNGESRVRSLDDLLDAHDLRSVIAEALQATPIDDEALRRGVWTFVGVERHAGTSPGHVIVALTDLVDDASISTLSARHAVMRRVILWCVEAYFGHLGGDVVGRAREALSDAPRDNQSDGAKG